MVTGESSAHNRGQDTYGYKQSRVTDRPPASEHNVEVHIMVENLHAVIAAIREAGGTVDPADIHTDGERWGVFTDPDANRFGIYQQPGVGD